MNRHALAALEYSRVREMVAGHFSSPAGRRAAEGWWPSPVAADVERLVEETAQMRAFLIEEGTLELAGVTLPDETLRKAGPEGACLTPAEALAVRRLCLVSRVCRTRLIPLENRFPLLASLARLLPVLNALEKRIFEVLDENGDFRDTASPDLGRIRKEAAATREQVTAFYRGLLARHSSEGIFQEDIVATRGGRYVLVVKAQAKGRLPGVIHDRTDSGAAVYLEPQEAVGLNNRLSELAGEEEEEKVRLLRRITDRIREDAEAVDSAGWQLGALDLVQARALFGLERSHSRPIFSTDGALKLRAGRHPVLARILGPGVVPLDLGVDPGQRALVITGPNTGGKTVTLKTVGLLCLMAQAGLFIPAEEGTELPLFDDVFADIGDEQSLEQNLSTFSAHIKNIAEAIQGAGPQSLVILDELGAGTDPTEGAPLAMAVIEHFLARGSFTLVSTHQGALVAFAASTPGAVNASMEFDRGSLKPTYRLVMGIPGRSNAREVARQMGVPETVIRRSRELQPQAEQGVSGLLADLNERRRRMENAARDLASREAAAASLLRERESEMEKTRREKGAVIAEARAEARKLLEKAGKDIREIVSRAGFEPGKARQRLHELKKEIDAKLPGAAWKSGKPLAGIPAVGQKVRLPQGRAEGKVQAVDPGKNMVRLEVHGKTVEIPMGILEGADGENAAPGKLFVNGGYSSGTGELATTRLDIRGKRVDEVHTELAQFLDQAWLSGIETVEILHGKGLGRLRDACAKILSGHPGVKEFGDAPLERGGYGVTVVKFK